MRVVCFQYDVRSPVRFIKLYPVQFIETVSLAKLLHKVLTDSIKPDKFLDFQILSTVLIMGVC